MKTNCPMQPSSSPATGTVHPRPLWVLLILLLALSACREKTPVITTRFNAFDTQVDVSLVGVSKTQAIQAAAVIEQDFAYLESDWQTSKPSPLARVNRLLASGDSFVAPPSILPLIRLSQTFETQSEGLFNPAIGRLMDLWGFHEDRLHAHPHPPPSPERIAQLVASHPNMAQIDIDGLDLRGHNRALDLDFNSIARGYAIDLSIEHLLDMGIKNALVQAGEHLRAIGDRSGQPWRIPIRRPNGSGVFAILAIRGDESVATVADYDHNFIFRGTLYHDIIDPRTGWPAQGTRAVTVVQKDTVTAAATATALFIAGPTDWQRIADRMDARDVLLIDAQGRALMSAGMTKRITLLDDNEPISSGSRAATVLNSDAAR